MLRSVLAVFLGYLAIAVTTMIFLAILAPVFGIPLDATSRSTAVPMGYLVCNLAAGLISAILGGWITAKRAPYQPMRHAAGLAVVLVILGVVFAMFDKGHPAPTWYFLVLPIIGVGGVLMGGVLAGQRGTAPTATG